jgi:cbb3-type cytochrome oxidase subunit 3
VTTLIALTIFIGILGWAYAPSRKQRFEEQGRMLLEIDDDGGRR